MPSGYTLSEKDKNKISRFINGRHSGYFFKNFLDITDGNVKDAIKLYHFDTRLRNTLFTYILKFELVLKNDFVYLAELSGASTTFWNNSSYYLSSATRVSPRNRYSKFDQLVYKVQQDISRKIFTNNPIQNVNVFYSISYGTFMRYFELIDSSYKCDFIKLHFNGTSNYYEFKKYLYAVKLIRNRCAHSNHIISPKLKVEHRISPLISMSPEFNILYTEFSKCLLFIHRTLKGKERKNFERDMLILLDRYMKVANKYFTKHTVDKNLNSKLRRIWRIRPKIISEFLYKFYFYVKI
jgi:abortive infection bacteriophage resistance protein